MNKSVDETVVVNSLLPKQWRCPHCGKVQKMDESAEEIFMEYFWVIRHCEKCMYLHAWRLKLTDDFKRKVVSMLIGDKETTDNADES